MIDRLLNGSLQILIKEKLTNIMGIISGICAYSFSGNIIPCFLILVNTEVRKRRS